MKISIVASSPDTQTAQLHTLLQRAGLANALPSASGISPNTWHDKLYKALEQTDPRQTQKPLVIGKAWEEMATGLVIANLDQPEWGFADSRSTWALDFWLQLDPQTRFVLAYTQPDHLDLSDPQTLATWLAYNTQLLRFYKANKNRAVLVNTSQVLAHPHRFVHTCQKLLGLSHLSWQAVQHDAADKPAVYAANPAAAKLAKQLASACTQLLSPSTAVVATPQTAGSKGLLADFFGLFGKARHLSEQLERAQATQAQAEAELAQANQLLLELAQQKQALETQHFEHKSEADLLLVQLHKVQEELEKQFIQAKQAQEQTKQVQEQLAKANAAKAEADKNAKQAQDQAAKANAAKADADKNTKQAQDQAKQAQDQAAKANAAKAEALKEAELLLQQLHQVQEELENYYLKNKQLEQGRQTHQTTHDRLARLLARLPTWADANTLAAQPTSQGEGHQALRVQTQQLWIGQNKPIASLAFELGQDNGQTYLEIRHAAGLPEHFLPWPDAHTDTQGKRLLLTAQDTATMALLSTTQWRTVKSILGLVPAHMGRMQALPAKDRPLWLHMVQTLAAVFEDQSKHLRYDHADAITVASPAAGQEMMRIAVRNLELGHYRNPLLVLDLTLQQKTTRGKTKTTHAHFDFRQWKEGVAPFAKWNPNQSDENGSFWRISLDIAKQRIDTDDFAELSPLDQTFMVALVKAMPSICEELDLSRFTLSLGQDAWGEGLLQAATLADYALDAQKHRNNERTSA